MAKGNNLEPYIKAILKMSEKEGDVVPWFSEPVDKTAERTKELNAVINGPVSAMIDSVTCAGEEITFDNAVVKSVLISNDANRKGLLDPRVIDRLRVFLGGANYRIKDIVSLNAFDDIVYFEPYDLDDYNPEPDMRRFLKELCKIVKRMELSAGDFTDKCEEGLIDFLSLLDGSSSLGKIELVAVGWYDDMYRTHSDVEVTDWLPEGDVINSDIALIDKHTATDHTLPMTDVAKQSDKEFLVECLLSGFHYIQSHDGDINTSKDFIAGLLKQLDGDYYNTVKLSLRLIGKKTPFNVLTLAESFIKYCDDNPNEISDGK